MARFRPQVHAYNMQKCTVNECVPKKGKLERLEGKIDQNPLVLLRCDSKPLDLGQEPCPNEGTG